MTPIDRVQAFLDRVKPCHFKKNWRCRVTCLKGDMCCFACEHLGPKGCMVKCLACKLYLCPQAFNAMTREQQQEFRELGKSCRGLPLPYRNRKNDDMGKQHPEGPPFIW